jgi:hypothetical protein
MLLVVELKEVVEVKRFFKIKIIPALGITAKKGSGSISTVGKLVVRAQIGLIFKREMEMVRSPRFEPGSSAWQADVLDQTRLRPHIHETGWSTTPVDV